LGRGSRLVRCSSGRCQFGKAGRIPIVCDPIAEVGDPIALFGGVVSPGCNCSTRLPGHLPGVGASIPVGTGLLICKFVLGAEAGAVVMGAIRRRLVPVRRELILVRRGLISVSQRLVAVRPFLIGIARGLVGVR